MPARLVPGLERRLKAEKVGGVRFDAFTRGRYSTDASHYQIMPLGVVAPRTIEEADRAIAVCRAEGVAVTARGGGTSQAGQTVNESLIVDCSPHLNRIVDLDAAGRRCVGRAGHRARRAQSQAETFRPVVSGRYIDRVARHHRRHGRQQFLRRALAALRQYARERAVDRRRAGRRHARAFRPARRSRRERAASRSSAISSPSPRARRARSSGAFRKCSAASAATISTRWCRAATTSISRIFWSARKARWRSRPRSS